MKILLGCLGIVGSLGLFAPNAKAQPAYGSYIGGGISFGVSEGSVANNEGRNTSALAAVRYKFLEIPISVRTQVLFGSSTAFVPTVSYDYPLNFDTDIYVGAGVALTNSASNTPVGNKTAFVIQPGIDYTIPNSNLVIFGNVIFALDGYRNGSGTATALQTGVGLRF
jgi:opacity protein-like surface antigen